MTDESLEQSESFISKESVGDDYHVWEFPDIKMVRAGQHVIKKTEPTRIELTPEDLERVKQLGYQEGYLKGHESGYATGVEEIQAHNRNLVSILNSLQKPLEAVEKETEYALIDLVKHLAQLVIHAELKIRDDYIIEIFEQSVNTLPISERTITLVINPADKEIIEKYLEEVNKYSWTLKEDAELMRGGCKVISENSVVDGSLESRLSEIMESVLFANTEQVPDDQKDPE